MEMIDVKEIRIYNLMCDKCNDYFVEEPDEDSFYKQEMYVTEEALTDSAYNDGWEERDSKHFCWRCIEEAEEQDTDTWVRDYMDSYSVRPVFSWQTLAASLMVSIEDEEELEFEKNHTAYGVHGLHA